MHEYTLEEIQECVEKNIDLFKELGSEFAKVEGAHYLASMNFGMASLACCLLDVIKKVKESNYSVSNN